jgi:hypothetical protein
MLKYNVIVNNYMRINMQEERFIVEVSLLVLIALTLLELYTITYYNQSISVRLIHILAPLLLFPFILIMIKHRSFASIILLIGIVCILGSLILLPDMLVNGILGYDKFYAISLRTFLLGLSAIAIGMIMIYRIEWLYVKNRPRDDTMRIWDHNMARGGLLVPLYRLLNDKERMLLPMYRYVVVRIYGNDYLVPTYESVPMDSVVVRSNDKMFIGVRKAL